MSVQTQYGVCNNVDINHIKEYQCGISEYTDCFCFTDYISNKSENEYLLFGFEVWKNKANEFHFFVEEGFKEGSSQTYDAEISVADREEIKKIYYEYIQRK